MSVNDTAPRDEWDDLSAQLTEDYPKSWQPNRTTDKKGKKLPASAIDAPEIKGTVLRVDLQSVAWQGQERMVDVAILATHPEGELRSVWMIHTTIAQDFARQQVKTGDKIAVLYEGKKDTKDGSGSYHSYRLAVRRSNAPAAAAATPPAERPDFGDEPPE